MLAAFVIIAGAAVAGAALAFAAWALARRFLAIAWPLPWVAAGGALFGVVIAASVLGGWFGAIRGAASLPPERALPYMEIMRQREQRLFERVHTSIIRDRQDGRSEEEVRANARALVDSFVLDKVAWLPDALTYELYATTRDQLAWLILQNDFDTCAKVALGHGKGDIEKVLAHELVERENNNVRRVLESRPNDREPAPAVQPAAMPAGQFSELASQAFAEAAQRASVPAEDVEKILAGAGEPQRACKLMKAFFDVLLAQPVEIAAAALRTLAAGERSPG